MVRISILYPATDGARFDLDYYRNVHAPLAMARLGHAVISFEIDEGIHAPPMPKPSFIAAGHYLCVSTAKFMSAYLPHADELQADVANYTSISPVIQLALVHSCLPAKP